MQAIQKAAIAQHVQKQQNGYMLHIDVSAKQLCVGKAQVQSISMFVTTEADDGEY